MGKKEKLTNTQNKNKDYINVLFCVLLVMAKTRNIFVVVFTNWAAAVFRSRQVLCRSGQGESVNKYWTHFSGHNISSESAAFVMILDNYHTLGGEFGIVSSRFKKRC